MGLLLLLALATAASELKFGPLTRVGVGEPAFFVF
jgi:hypothetical protein